MKNQVQLFICLLAGMVSLSAAAQRSPQNNVYAEILGLSFRYSVGYERVEPLFKNRRVLIAGNTGVGVLQYYLSKGFCIPLGIKVCAGWRQVYAELGVDFLYVNEKSPAFYRTKSPWSAPTSTFFRFFHAGIRYQPKRKGIFLRAFVFPIKAEPGEKEVLNYYIGASSYKILQSKSQDYLWWGGIGIGCAF